MRHNICIARARCSGYVCISYSIVTYIYIYIYIISYAIHWRAGSDILGWTTSAHPTEELQDSAASGGTPFSRNNNDNDNNNNDNDDDNNNDDNNNDTIIIIIINILIINDKDNIINAT